MDRDRYLALLESDGNLLADSAGRDLDAAVPPCPGWVVRDVVTHTAEVYEHKLACIALRAAPQPWPPAWPADRDPLEWFADAHGRLLDVLRSTDPATPAYTWFPPDQTVGFWVRRMAQETAVHRVDTQSALAEAVTPVDDELAVDGVDEVLELMLAGDWSDEPVAAGAGTRVEVSAGGRAWVVALQPESVQVSAPDGSPVDAGVSGAPSDVLLWLWGRTSDDSVMLSGDRALGQVFRERLALATQ